MSGAIGIDIAVAKPVTMAVLLSSRSRDWHIASRMPSTSKSILESLIFSKGLSGATHAAIEDPFVGPNKRGALQLARVYGRMEVLCEQAGLIVIPAPPNVWQPDMLTQRGGSGPLGPRKIRKALSLLVAKELGADCADDDEADAVCIAEWANKKLQLEAAKRGTT